MGTFNIRLKNRRRHDCEMWIVKCAIFSKNVATLTPLSLQAKIVPKKSIEKPQYKRHRRKKPTEFHSSLPNFHKTLQSKTIVKKFKILRNDPETRNILPPPLVTSFTRQKHSQLSSQEHI